MRLSRFLLIIPVVAVLTACGAADQPPEPVLTDSAGVTIVENPVPDGRLAFAVDTAPALSIGALEGAAEYTFESVRDAKRLPDGRTVVADGSELKFYDEAGRHLLTAGGEGEGPGEFSFLTSVVVCGGEILAGDLRQQRLSRFSLDGTFLQADALPASGNMIFAVSLESCDEATGLPILEAPHPLTGPGAEPPAGELVKPVLRLARGGEGVDTIARLPALEREEGVSSPFAPFLAIEYDGTTAHSLNTAALEVRTFVAGDLARIARLPHTPRPLGADDNQRAIDARVEGMPAQFGEMMRSQMEAAEVPSQMPAARAFVADAAGRLWIQPYTAPWEDPATDWLVLDADGALLGTAALPLRFRPLEIGEDWMLGETKDELDVSYVRVYRFAEP